MKLEIEKRTEKGDEIIFSSDNWNVVRVLNKENKIIERIQHTKDA